MCHYKLDYYDASLEILGLYLPSHPESIAGVNLKASNNYRLIDAKSAAPDLKVLTDKGHQHQGQ